MKKSQITGQIFVYIIIIVVVGLIFLLGYNYSSKLISLKCDAEKTSFEKSLESFADKYDGYGEVANEKLKAPCDYKKVCFVDSEYIKQQSHETGMIDNPIIRLSLEEGAEQNVFIIGKQTEPMGFSSKIRVEGNYVCINQTRGYFNIRFRGTSEQAFVEGY